MDVQNSHAPSLGWSSVHKAIPTELSLLTTGKTILEVPMFVSKHGNQLVAPTPICLPRTLNCRGGGGGGRGGKGPHLATHFNNCVKHAHLPFFQLKAAHTGLDRTQTNHSILGPSRRLASCCSRRIFETAFEHPFKFHQASGGLAKNSSPTRRFALPLKAPSPGEVNLLQTHSSCYPKS